MKKKKASKSRNSKPSRSYGLGSNKYFYGIADDFILIAGGAFLLVIFGIMILYLGGTLKV